MIIPNLPLIDLQLTLQNSALILVCRFPRTSSFHRPSGAPDLNTRSYTTHVRCHWLAADDTLHLPQFSSMSCSSLQSARPSPCTTLLGIHRLACLRLLYLATSPAQSLRAIVGNWLYLHAYTSYRARCNILRYQTLTPRHIRSRINSRSFQPRSSASCSSEANFQRANG